jgi:hypothetical protein
MRINYEPLGYHIVHKWERILLGQRLHTLIIEDPAFVKRRRLSTSVKELQFDVTNPQGRYQVLNSRNWWEEYQPANPAPVIDSVSVEYTEQAPYCVQDVQVRRVVSLCRGDSFVKAFPHVTKLKFKPEPDLRFFDQPPSVFSNVRELAFSHKSDLEVVESFSRFLDRFKNLETLSLMDDCSWEYLWRIDKGFVLRSLRTLRMVNIDNALNCPEAWCGMSRQFPHLTTVHVDLCRPLQPDEAYPEIPFYLVTKLFKRLENVVVKNYAVPLDSVLAIAVHIGLNRPARLRSVVFQSLLLKEVVLTDAQTSKIQTIAEFPGFELDFHLTNGDNERLKGGFHFALSRV